MGFSSAVNGYNVGHTIITTQIPCWQRFILKEGFIPRDGRKYYRTTSLKCALYPNFLARQVKISQRHHEIDTIAFTWRKVHLALEVFFHNMRQSKRHQGLSVDLCDIIDYLLSIVMCVYWIQHTHTQQSSDELHSRCRRPNICFLSIHKKYLLSKITVTWASGENFAFIHYHFPR